MKQTYNPIIVFLVTVLSVIGLLFHFSGGILASVGVPAIFSAVVSIIMCGLIVEAVKKPSLPVGMRKRTTEISLPRIVQKQATDEADPVDPGYLLGPMHRKKIWTETDDSINTALDKALEMVYAYTGAYTAAVFFSSEDGGYMLRRYTSNCSDVNKDAIIYRGVGIIGSFLKDGLTLLNLREIVSDSSTLYYYLNDTGIRSLIACPVYCGGKEIGVLLADSTQKSHFGEKESTFLTNMATLVGRLVYSSYQCGGYRLQHERLAAMSTIEKDFFTNLSRDTIIEKIMSFVPLTVPCDRLTLSIRSDDGTSATIVSAAGIDAALFTGRSFSLSEKTLIPVLYAKSMILSRNYSTEHYETRYFVDEPKHTELRSFAAIPLGVAMCSGVLLVESCREDAFDEYARELLGRLAISAGLAIEQLFTFEKTKALATHDGLTGLYNHRTFQQQLTDEITRAIRYSEAVSVIIGDIDFFKNVNDSYGHPFGDTVLKEVSNVLQNSVRQDIDTVARYGGEEFAIILVKTDTVGAAETAERIRAAIAGIPFLSPGGVDVKVTMSFGIAEFKKDARQVNELIAKADKALYRAKERGRDRVEVF